MYLTPERFNKIVPDYKVFDVPNPYKVESITPTKGGFSVIGKVDKNKAANLFIETYAKGKVSFTTRLVKSECIRGTHFVKYTNRFYVVGEQKLKGILFEYKDVQFALCKKDNRFDMYHIESGWSICSGLDKYEAIHVFLQTMEKNYNKLSAAIKNRENSIIKQSLPLWLL